MIDYVTYRSYFSINTPSTIVLPYIYLNWPAPNDDMPINEFTTEVDTRFSERPKSAEHGIWPGDIYLGKRLIHISGDLMEVDSSTYIARRAQVLSALMPKAYLTPLKGYPRASGYLECQFTGQTEVWTTDVSLDSYPEIPLQGLSPSRSPYMFNFKAFDPRFYGVLNTSHQVPGAYPYNFNITNAGNVETYPIIRINGPWTNAHPQKGGYSFTINTPATITLTMSNLVLLSGDYLELDFGKRTVYKTTAAGVVTNQYGLVRSPTDGPGGPWWPMEPGVHTITLGNTYTSNPASIDFMWKNAYMI